MTRTMQRLAGACAVMTLAGAACALDTIRVALLEIEGTPLEQPSPYAWLAGPDAPLTLRDLTGQIRELGEGDYDRVLLRLKDAALSETQIEEIGQAIREVRDAGVPVHMFGEIYGTAEVLLGAYCDETILQAGGAVSLTGLYMEQMFLKDTLSWLGITPDFIQVGDYKGANEMMMNSEPSKAWDQNLNGLLDGLYENRRQTLMTGLGLNDRQLTEAMERGWLATGPEAIKLGLIDSEVDLSDLTEHIETIAGADVRWEKIEPAGESPLASSNPFAVFRMLMESPSHEPDGDTIAILHIDGPIVDGDSSPGGLFGSPSTGSRTIRNALQDIAREDDIGAIVLRIDSPGGSAIASEVIWQGVRDVAQSKPVIVSVGSMAASGGYYIAVSGDEIFVNDSSVVGSIGVVGGKMALGGLYDKLRINVVPYTRGPQADLFSSTDPWTSRQQALVRERMTQIYDQFTKRVKQGRPAIDLAKTAEGRLFTGDIAVSLRMADRVGTLEDAIARAAEKAGFDAGAFDVMHYPGPKSLDELLSEAFGGTITAPRSLLHDAVATLRDVVGPAAWRQLGGQIEAMSQLRNEPVILTMPNALIFR